MGSVRALGSLHFSAGLLSLLILVSCSRAAPSPRDVIVLGSTAWNEWRENNPDAAPDLSGIVLDGVDLRSANLNKTRLTGATLRNAQLAGASLKEAELSGADLQEADLDAADLSGAILSQANLEGANLSHCNLSGADLSKAKIGKARLTSANLSNATVDQLSDWRDIPDMRGANVYRVIKAPSGFKDFAMGMGARKDG